MEPSAPDSAGRRSASACSAIRTIQSTRLDHQAPVAPIAATLGLTLVAADAGSPAEFEPAVARLIANRSEAIFPGSVLAYNLRGRLIELAKAESRLPVIVGLRAVWAEQRCSVLIRHLAG